MKKRNDPLTKAYIVFISTIILFSVILLMAGYLGKPKQVFPEEYTQINLDNQEIHQSFEDAQNPYQKREYPQWNITTIPYIIIGKEACEEKQITKLKEGFVEISNATQNAITFKEVNQKDAKIIVKCVDSQKEIDNAQSCFIYTYNGFKREKEVDIFKDGIIDKDKEILISLDDKGKDAQGNSQFEVCYVNKSDLSFPLRENQVSIEQKGMKTFYDLSILGEASPQINLKTNIIENGTIYLYKKQDICTYPVTQIHETLHVFALDHPDLPQKGNILNTYIDCTLRITPTQKACLQYIYANNSDGSSCRKVYFLGEEEES